MPQGIASFRAYICVKYDINETQHVVDNLKNQLIKDFLDFNYIVKSAEIKSAV
jgi:hypothetical protein